MIIIVYHAVSFFQTQCPVAEGALLQRDVKTKRTSLTFETTSFIDETRDIQTPQTLKGYRKSLQE